MLDEFLDKIKHIFSSRILSLFVVFAVIFAILFQRIFVMQVIEGVDVAQADEYKIPIVRDVKSTRGLIYDRNGVLLAENELRYSVVMSQSALLTTNAERNAMIHRLITILEKHGNEIELNFPIELDKNNKLIFNISGNAEIRFKNDAYGRSFNPKNSLTEEEENSTAEQVFEFLRTNKWRFQISDDYTLEETLKIMTVRYNMLIQDPQYSQFTVSSDVDVETIAAVKENMADLPGVEIKEQTYRIYHDALYFAHLIGYTGLITSTELEKYNEDSNELNDVKYQATDHVGKIGIEKSKEDILAGTKGIEQINVNGSNRVIDSQILSMPVKGDDIYLSIDRDLQVACYNILERNIAAILISKITNSMSYGTKNKNASGILIPIYEVYNALIDNNVIDVRHFTAADATDLERRVQGYFVEKRVGILSNLRTLTKFESKTTNAAAGSEMQEYLEYIYQLMQSDTANNVVIRSRVDMKDPVYLDYVNSKISLAEYLQYAISEKWIDLSVLGIEEDYYTVEEIYIILIDYIFDLLENEELRQNDTEFEKKIFRTLIFTNKLSGKEICLLLFDQNVIEYNEDEYRKVSSGNLSPYNFIIKKIENLEITPAQLALEPCSGSIVINDVNTGEVLALVSYPSYDNNKMANKIDSLYYSKLVNDRTHPLQNRPAQELTTTGSTFKPLAGLIGIGENLITTSTRIYDKGVFDLVDPAPKCWKSPGTHGNVNLTEAIMHSCNYFFYDIGYRLSLRGSIYDDTKGLEKIREYAAMFGLDNKTQIETEESTPTIASKDAVRGMIGYYHNVSPVQISRYMSTVANKGTCLDFTLIHDIKNADHTPYTSEPVIYNEITQFSQNDWNAVHSGMYKVVHTGTLNSLYGNLGTSVAGKTGTAQVSLTKPNHALFTSFAPYDDPEICVSVVIPNGYTSANAAYIAREVYGLYFNGENKEALLSGNVKAGTATDIRISD